LEKGFVLRKETFWYDSTLCRKEAHDNDAITTSVYNSDRICIIWMCHPWKLSSVFPGLQKQTVLSSSVYVYIWIKYTYEWIFHFPSSVTFPTTVAYEAPWHSGTEDYKNDFNISIAMKHK